MGVTEGDFSIYVDVILGICTIPFCHTMAVGHIYSHSRLMFTNRGISFRRFPPAVCVCFLPIHSGHEVRWMYQPGSHRRKVTQDF